MQSDTSLMPQTTSFFAGTTLYLPVAHEGALLALGLLRGYADPADPELKKAHYRLVQEYARRFREENGTIICRELLKNVPVAPGDTPEPRTPEFYARRPCLRLAGQAAAILEQMLKETEKKEEERP